MTNLIINYYFTALFVLPVVSNFLMKFWDPSDATILNFSDELALIITMPLAFRGFLSLIKQKFGFIFFLLWFLYIIIGLFISLIHQTPFSQVLYQLALELKYPLILSVAYGVTTFSRGLMLKFFINFSKLVILMSIPLVLWQFISPSTYDQFFPNGAHHGVFILQDGTTLARSSGIFWFTGELAIFSGTLFCYFFFQFYKYRRSSDVFWLIITLMLLASTLSRLEILGTFLGVSLVLFILQNGVNKVAYTFGSIIIVSILLISIFPFLHSIYVEQGLDDIQSSTSARTVFYYYSFVISSMYFPFGSGLGTYGGQSAVLFDSLIYEILDFHYYGWYTLKIQMTDTFWPHILGETGIIGFILYSLSIFILLNRSRITLAVAKISNHTDLTAVSAAGMASFILVLVNSLASPVFYSFFSLLPAMLFISQAIYLEKHSATVISSTYLFKRHSSSIPADA